MHYRGRSLFEKRSVNMENNINVNSLQNVLGNMLMSSNGKSSLPQEDKSNKKRQDADVVLAKVSDYRRES